MISRLLTRAGATLLGCAAISLALLAASPAADADFSFSSLTGATSNGGQPTRQAGAHPDLSTTLGFSGGAVRDVAVDLPPGFTGNPTAAPTCSSLLLTAGNASGTQGNSSLCPIEAQVGTVDVYDAGFDAEGNFLPIYNLETEPGELAAFGFNYSGVIGRIVPRLRPGDYGITAEARGISSAQVITGLKVTLWGVPADPSHDADRFLGDAYFADLGHPSPDSRKAFLANSTSCGGPAALTAAAADSWEQAGLFAHAFFDVDSAGIPFVNEGCNQLDFSPTIEARPSTNLADSPSGLDVNIHIPQDLSKDPDGFAEAHLRDAVVTLPAGMSVNPASAAGLGACTPSQIGFTSNGNQSQLIGKPLAGSAFRLGFEGQTTGGLGSGDASVPATGSGTLNAAKGSAGFVPAGLSEIYEVETSAGSFAVGQTISAAGIPAGTTITSVQPETPTLIAIGISNPATAGGFGVPVSAGSSVVTDVQTSSGSFAVGQDIAGDGIPAGTTIAAVGTETLTLSKPVVAGGIGVALTVASATLTDVQTSAGAFLVGDAISGAGIPAGATITGVGPGTLTLSTPVTAAGTGISLNSGLPADSSAEAVQAALEALANLAPGDLTVTGAPGGSWKVQFSGSRAGQNPAPIEVVPIPGGEAIPARVLESAGEARFDGSSASCPDASKLGTVEVETPVLDHPLKGTLYLASQNDNPFDSLLALYIAIEDPKTGVVIKLAGHPVPDPETGQLKISFEQNPQLPFEDLTVKLFNGPRAALRTPMTCGNFTTTSVLTPWSAPEGAVATPSDTFGIIAGAGGSPCLKTEAEAPNAPSFSAGTVDPSAGSYSPFVLKITRADGTQPLKAIDATLPKGLLGKLAGIPYCPDGSLAAAQSRSGQAEQLSPSCPSASQVGSVTVGAGAGSNPIYVTGKAYLAGPYKGAPLSLAIVTPAVAGPFDLGTVVVRNALQVDPETAQIHAVSDPIPTILQGIPLDIRSIVLSVDRPGFTLNPTSCNPSAVTGGATSVFGQVAALSDPFQVGGCGALGFKPRLAIDLQGGTRRSAYPALRATLRAKPGQANIAKAAVSLPHSEFLAQEHIRTVCTRVQFAAGSCPKGSIYGKARAFSPLLDRPLEGPVYLRSSDHPLPDLVADLKGQIRVVLAGRIDSVNGGIRTRFEAVPDAPVSKFVLEMRGGRKGLLVNSRNLCNSTNKATVKLDAHNGKYLDSRPVVSNDCRAKRHKKRG